MLKNNIQEELIVNNHKVRVILYNGIEYISLTDLARYKNTEFPGEVIIKWMSNKSSFDFYSLWEEINNKDFKLAESRQFKIEAAEQSFTMSPSRWIGLFNAIGFISKRGKYDSGTYAVSDIAFEFASWLSPEFKLYLITEFQRLKKSEAYQNKLDWHASRVLTKINYLVHTDAVKNYIVPTLTEEQKRYVYQEEADLLNVALFGMTAKEWRDKNPELSLEGNIRDFADLLHLVILNNLENINAELIKMNLSQKDRLVKLNDIARCQMNLLISNNHNIINNNSKEFIP